MSRVPYLAALAVTVCLLSACQADRTTRREPPLRRAQPQCPAAGTEECQARCGSRSDAAPGSSEGKCEAVLDDLCRSHCTAACGENTAALQSHIAEQESYLESRCGSGKAVEPGDSLAPPPVPTPHPLNDLMH
jgi:hypothetical protein